MAPRWPCFRGTEWKRLAIGENSSFLLPQCFCRWLIYLLRRVAARFCCGRMLQTHWHRIFIFRIGVLRRWDGGQRGAPTSKQGTTANGQLDNSQSRFRSRIDEIGQELA